MPLSVALKTAVSTYLSPKKQRITKATSEGIPFLIIYALVNMIGISKYRIEKIINIILGFFATLFQVTNALTWLNLVGITAAIAYCRFYVGLYY